MLVISSTTYDRLSETFIRAHVRHIAPSRTVLLCREDGGAAALGGPVLSDMRGFDEARVRSFLHRHGVTIVLTEYGPNGSLLRVACKRASGPLFVHFHGYDATKLAKEAGWRRHYRAFFRGIAIIVRAFFHQTSLYLTLKRVKRSQRCTLLITT